MVITHSANVRSRSNPPDLTDVLQQVSAERLRSLVETLAFPRHYHAEHNANIRARDLIRDYLTEYGYTVTLQGEWDNVLARIPGSTAPYVLLAAHYDTVPGCPGADDNTSAIAACLECARILSQLGITRAAIAIFNREEDGLLGSRSFVQDMPTDFAVAEAHVFEMVGFRSSAPNSQTLPAGLPITVPEVGDFLAVLANQNSHRLADDLLSLAHSHVPGLPVLALKTFLGVEKHFPHLLRSDHAPFWEAGIPTLMWTDTSEFRNPHYHRATDTPETLDYDFLADITRLALAHILTTVSAS